MKARNRLAKADSRLAKHYAAQIAATVREIMPIWEGLVTHMAAAATLFADLDHRFNSDAKKSVMRELSRDEQTIFRMLAKLGADCRLREARR